MAPPADSSDTDMTANDHDASDLAVDIERVADAVKDELRPGDQIGDLVVVSRRQLIAFATGAAGIGALAQFGISEAQAQDAAGQVGTSDEPVDLFAANYGSTSTASGYELTVEGDTYQFNE